jgi:membrane associated rhomboid family serine protease
MTSGADLFVVCKQCGSEVSPYITECPYCGNRLRRRAPKLPRAQAPSRSPRARTRLRRLLAPPKLARRRGLRGGRAGFAGRSFGVRPYATIALVAASCGVWIALHAQPSLDAKLAILGPLHGEWWKLLTYQFAYGSGVYAFTTLIALAIFGWLLEQRYGPVVVLALFLGAGAAGALVASAVYPVAVLSGGNAGALALLAAWAAPDLKSARRGSYYDGDLLGAAAIAALLLAMPFAIEPLGILDFHPIVRGTSWLAGVTGGAVGLALGLGLHRMQETEL